MAVNVEREPLWASYKLEEAPVLDVDRFLFGLSNLSALTDQFEAVIQLYADVNARSGRHSLERREVRIAVNKSVNAIAAQLASVAGLAAEANLGELCVIGYDAADRITKSKAVIRGDVQDLNYALHVALSRGRQLVDEVNAEIAMKAGQVPRRPVSPASRRAVACAVRLLPAGQRERYRDEYLSELEELAQGDRGRRNQVAYAFRLLRTAPALRLALRMSAPEFQERAR